LLSTYILCNFFQFKLKLWVPIPIRWGVLGTTLCDKVCQWLAEGRWFSPGPPVSATNKTNGHDITEILLKVALSILTLVQINKQQDLCELIKKRQHAVCYTEQVLTKWKHIKQYRYLIFLQLFQQVVGIPMGTNCAPFLADLFLYSYESEFHQKLLKDKKIHEARAFNFTYRYIDDVLSINNSRFAEFLPLI
jgi:hypothetical protein